MKKGSRNVLSVLGTAVLLIAVWILKEKIEEEAWWRSKKFLTKTDGPSYS